MGDAQHLEKMGECGFDKIFHQTLGKHAALTRLGSVLVTCSLCVGSCVVIVHHVVQVRLRSVLCPVALYDNDARN